MTYSHRIPPHQWVLAHATDGVRCPQWRSCRWADTATVSAVECDEYQRAAMRTARDKNAPDEFMHLVLGLVGEAGEIAEKVKKLVRDKNSDLAQLDRDDMAAELGDVLWYTAVLADFLGLSLDDVAQRNVDKLADRQARAVLGGSGDNR
jgi:NTP pyrophosphatase (non-canonical NTP hydrolase)